MLKWISSSTKPGRRTPRAATQPTTRWLSRREQDLDRADTRFVRSWNGRTVSVEAQTDGFVFEDRYYQSLSAIAREVTGTNWSGPRFFGLRGEGARGK
ncbi:DUF2924 domain-containing protein [Altererythrobacter buctensis]|uniref:DUF2924 domain-containing protein n=1 Tax=Alteraurantiacibacter buctensis TaxID=1503981 RepID=A0A844Z1J1_9SPHN|nr:DUF2924 domain-containing protein [Alteraurantiacibacter buctensis]